MMGHRRYLAGSAIYGLALWPDELICDKSVEEMREEMTCASSFITIGLGAIGTSLVPAFRRILRFVC
jgi:hypothetical protein